MRCRYPPSLRVYAGAAVRPAALGFLVLLAAVLQFASGTARAQSSPEEGRGIFEGQCVACHTLGGGDLVGPDLQAVTERRAPDWLARFILDPEKVIEQGDPVAKALVEKYRTPMPTLGLSQQEVGAVIAYLAVTTQAARTIPTAYLPTLAIAVLALLALTLIALWAGNKRVEVRP